MLNKKLVFVSIGGGILLFVIGSFLLLLTWKILKSPEWMSTVIAWILVWPVLLLVRVFPLPYPGTVGVVFALSIGITADVAILSGIIYAALSLLRRKSLGPPPSSTASSLRVKQDLKVLLSFLQAAFVT
jgi:hypothetical protein